MRRACAWTAVLVLVAAWALPARAAESPWRWLWVYAPRNFQVNERVDDLITLMGRAKKAGYNGVIIGDSKFGRIEGRPDWYYTNLARTRKAAEDLGLELIPAVMSVGYSNDVLQNNPNLAEGMPVRDCPMLVKGGRATVADPSNRLPNGGFEETRGDKIAGWDWMDECVRRDTEVRHSGAASARVDKFREGSSHGNGRLVKKLALAPYRQYRVDAWIKTRDLAPAASLLINPLAEGRALNHATLGARPTQDWTLHSILFNTLEHAEVSLYIGIWGGKEGAFWMDDVSVHEVAGVNMVRREGCPLRVTSADGRTVYEEGRDFQPWAYPKMGRVPWPGAYEVVHPEPPLVLAPGSRIQEGETLKVSFYHTVVIYDGQVSACLVHDELFGYMEKQVRLIKQHFAPRKYLMSHDELRVAGHCELCRAGGKTAGQVLAENVRRCREIIRRVDPDAEVFVWSDMFDPNHNAVDKYYLVPSTLAGSWEGLPKDVNVACWYFEKRDASMPFFAQRGHKMIMAGYYDTDDVRANVMGWRDAAAKVKGADGLIYTTWRSEYKDLETFAKFALQPRP